MKTINKLTHQQKMEIYNNHKSGQYYVKEICEEFHISTWTYKKVIEEVEKLIKETLYGAK